MKKFTTLLWLCIGAFALSSGAAPTASVATGLIDTGMLQQPPPRPGSYAVGRQTFAYVDTDRDNRLLVMDVWYPVDKVDTRGAVKSAYDLVFTTLESPNALQSPRVSGAGPFPLLVFSHGNLGIRFQSYFLMEALAANGFVVVAPDHAGNTAQDLVFGTLESFEASALNRPQDMRFTIDRMLERNALPNDAFAGRIDPQRIGTLGHSFGGYTSLATASGIDGVAADTRVIAIAPFAPASGLLSDAQLQAITTPTLILGGTADITTPVDNQSSRPMALISAPQRVRIDLQNAGHQSFTDICDLSTALIDAGIDQDFVAFLLGNAEEGCAPELMPIAQAQALTRLFMIAFMKTYVAGQPGYAQFLTPGYAIRHHLPVTVYHP